jgi:hypothetical protein
MKRFGYNFGYNNHMRLFFLILLLLTFAGPLAVALSGKIDFRADYRTANRDSSHIAPGPNTTPDAVIQVYSARAFNWRGLFAVHTWIAVKPKDAKQYTVYQVVGWRLLRNLPPVVAMQDIPDRNWFDQKPTIILDIRGKEAEAIIPNMAAAVQSYPYPHSYLTWPGPNSNTFTAYIGRQIPKMQLTLPSNALGKDFLPDSIFVARTPSGTGYQISIYGVLGIALAVREGLEINFLGLVYGFSPVTRTIKLPGFGDFRI